MVNKELTVNNLVARIDAVAKRYKTLILTITVFFFTAIVLRNAWLGDDAYITFRTIRNFINGYGLVWNIDERVQTFTHPLWLFLLTGVIFLTGETYFSVLITSIIISLVTLILFSFFLNDSALAAVLGVLAFTLSKAFVDYSTSGLENPLTHLLLILFLIIYLKSSITPKNLFLLAFLACLGTLNRMDTVLLYAPMLVYWIVKLRSIKAVILVGLGFAPFFLWEIFSLFYYGFPFPNTAYAKLNASASQSALIEQGLYYLLNSIRQDPLTLMLVSTGIALSFFTGNGNLFAPIIGVILYLLYMIKIGGDFMGGRFFTAPFLVSVSLILASLNRVKGSNSKTHQRTYSLSVILIFIALALSIVSPYSPLWSGPDYGIQQQVTDQRGIADERADYYQLTGLLLWKKNIPQNLHREFYAKAQSYLNSDSLTIGGIGFIGFYANENLHIIDRYALADPLLARLPPVTINLRQIRIWPELVKMGNRPGHFRRIAPKGYAETIQTGQNMLQDPNLALYYDKLSLVTRGDLHNFNRLPVIIAFNLGNYDYLLHNYLTSYEINLPNVTTPISFDGIDDITLYHTIDIRFPEITYAKSANITFQSPTTKLNSNDYQEYWLGIIKGGHLLALEELIIPDQTADSFSGRITIPQIAHTQGFDRVIIGPSKTNNEYLSHDLEKIKSIELVN